MFDVLLCRRYSCTRLPNTRHTLVSKSNARWTGVIAVFWVRARETRFSGTELHRVNGKCLQHVAPPLRRRKGYGRIRWVTLGHQKESNQLGGDVTCTQQKAHSLATTSPGIPRHTPPVFGLKCCNRHTKWSPIATICF